MYRDDSRVYSCGNLANLRFFTYLNGWVGEESRKKYVIPQDKSPYAQLILP